MKITNIKNRISILIALIVICTLSSNYSYAEQLRKMASFQDWVVFKSTSLYQDPVVCYAMATPYRTRALDSLRDLPYFAIKQEKSGEFMITTTPGYSLDKKLAIEITVGDKLFNLGRRSSEFAWTDSRIQDQTLIDNFLKNNDFFTVRTYSRDNKTALDYYSLHGLKDALSYMKNRCAKN